MSSNEESVNIMISGAHSCSGSIQISGAKNAALPLMAACLLTDKQVTLENVPKITDVDVMKIQLQSYGVQVTNNGSRFQIHAADDRGQTRSSPTSSNGSKTRGSFLVLGPLLARFGKAKVYHPGGCKLGEKDGRRPVDYHIKALEKMGARLESNSDHIVLKADQGLRGARIDCTCFEKISVGATENVIMAACLADGKTVITNAAVEPEIIDLIKMLNAMGMEGNIDVHEGNMIEVNGLGRGLGRGTLLNGCTHTLIPDRIEAGTWAIAAAITGGSLTLVMNPEIGKKIMVPVLQMLENAGVNVKWRRNGLEVQRRGQINPVSITTGPFPQFPTDLLPQWVTFMTLANGSSMIKETIWPNRFSHVPHLEKMGAKFTMIMKQSEEDDEHTEYKVHGKATLIGKHVEATDLRAGAALILAALAATESTKIKGFQHVLRGYENIKEKLKCWGVQFRNPPQTREGFYGGNQARRDDQNE